MAKGEIRRALLTDLEQIINLYRETIVAVNIKHYTAEQTSAWAGRAEDADAWAGKINEQHFFVNEQDGLVTGFASLTNGGHIDMLFVHKNHEGEGIASQLLHHLERIAHTKGISYLTTDASKTARPVFEHFRFNVSAEQTVVVDGVSLNNFKMTKQLTP